MVSQQSMCRSDILNCCCFLYNCLVAFKDVRYFYFIVFVKHRKLVFSNYRFAKIFYLLLCLHNVQLCCNHSIESASFITISTDSVSVVAISTDSASYSHFYRLCLCCNHFYRQRPVVTISTDSASFITISADPASLITISTDSAYFRTISTDSASVVPFLQTPPL